MSCSERKTHETICIQCRYACSHKCSWAWEFIPVPGWTAIETRNGYDVLKCPNFKEGRGLSRSVDVDGVIACLQALMDQTREDYIKGIDIHLDDDGKPIKVKYQKKTRLEDKLVEAAKNRAKNRRSIEDWIRGDGSKMMMLSDPEAVIQQLRKFAKKYEEEQTMISRCTSRRVWP